MSKPIEVKLSDQGTQAILGELVKTLENPRSIFAEISNILLFQTERNFASQGNPRWQPLAKSTEKARLKKNKGSTVYQILQDTTALARSVTPSYGHDYAALTTNTPYAPAHQFGATINHPARTRKVSLATKKDGSLKRQRSNSNLAVFARKGSSARHTLVQSKAYTINIPARPFMPFTGTANNATLQPEAESSILDYLQRVLAGQ